MFSPVYDNSYTFAEYYSDLTTRESDNNTQFGMEDRTTQYNIQQGFLRISVTGNQIYNSTGFLNATDVVDYPARFSIQRLNYLDVWAETDGNQYESSTFTSSANENINS